jgi:di/tricarboxylate transporter
VTLVGTSPNVIVSSVRESILGEPYQLFDFAPVGLGICVAGFIFLAIAPYFIRIDRSPPAGVEQALESAHYVTEMSLPEGSEFAGQSCTELEKLAGADVKLVSVITNGKRRKCAADIVMAEGDRIVVEGEQEDLEKFAASAKLTLTGERHREGKESAEEIRVVEGVIGQSSRLAHRTVAQARLHEQYGLSVLAVSRGGARITTELRAVRLRAGDVIIFKAVDADMGAAFAELQVLPLTERKVALGTKRFGLAPVVLLGAAILAITMGWAPIHLAFAAAAVGVLLLRVMGVTEAYRAIDGSMLVLLAALIPLSEAIERTGGAALLAAPLSDLLQPMPSYLAVATLIIVGMAITPFLNNAATVLIVAPMAAAVASRLGVNPDAYLMAVAIGAACDFLTPIGHQCNTLVMGPGRLSLRRLLAAGASAIGHRGDRRDAAHRPGVGRRAAACAGLETRDVLDGVSQRSVVLVCHGHVFARLERVATQLEDRLVILGRACLIVEEPVAAAPLQQPLARGWEVRREMPHRALGVIGLPGSLIQQSCAVQRGDERVAVTVIAIGELSTGIACKTQRDAKQRHGPVLLWPAQQLSTRGAGGLATDQIALPRDRGSASMLRPAG